MKKVLVVNPFGIGDTIFSFYVVEALKADRPGLSVGFLCNERTAALARLNRGLDDVYEFDRDRLRGLRSRDALGFLTAYRTLVARWRSGRYDSMLDYSLGREFSFLGFLAGIPRRIGFDYKGRGFFLSHKLAFKGYENEPVTATQLRLLRFLDVRVSEAPAVLPWNIPDSAARRAGFVLKETPVRRWMALAPGGGKSWGADAVYKQWDAHKFAEAANAWSKKAGAGVMLLGDASETALLEEVRVRLEVPSALFSGEPMDLVTALLCHAHFLLCNDGGLLHLAHSLGMKTVSIFGPVDEAVYGPYGDPTRCETVTEPVPCRPCYRRFHFPPCAHERRCLAELSVQKVLESIENIA